ncbi:hypothetical protein F4820DRAFT_213738 [Hypoxylon rubiginosum]|uniref:Uncharacterized protein n=1 Tax=Hypoxylon rubiginosum TaxID=110542 RepID=A0ACB9Z854_9PEZI|nr:hypothetical protein F4820DRAFT_213738 [Hypoxylon rubiginosum]
MPQWAVLLVLLGRIQVPGNASSGDGRRGWWQLETIGIGEDLVARVEVRSSSVLNRKLTNQTVWELSLAHRPSGHWALGTGHSYH